MSASQSRWGMVVSAALVVAAVPSVLLLSSFSLSQLTLAAAYCVAIVGLNVVTGLSGQASLAQGAFFAVGAYASGLTSMAWHLPFPLAPFVGAVVSAMLGLVVGLPALRLRGHYLAIVTLGVSVAVVPLANRWASLTGGGAGLNIGLVSVPSFIDASADQYVFVWTCLIVAMAILAASRMSETPLGIAMASARENETAALAMGVDLRAIKIGAFGASAFFGGLGGGIYAASTGFVAPENFTATLSLMLLVGAVIGGIRCIPCAIVGALFVQFVPDAAVAVNAHLAGVLFGLCIVLLIRFMPDGPMDFLASKTGRPQVLRSTGVKNEQLETSRR